MLDIKTLLADLDTHIHQFHDRSAKWLEAAVWQQVIYYLYLFIFHRRSADEQPVLADIVAETHPYLGLSDEEEQLMQSMAEVTFQQGKQEGIAQGRQEGRQEGEKRGTIESILALLDMRLRQTLSPPYDPFLKL